MYYGFYFEKRRIKKICWVLGLFGGDGKRRLSLDSLGRKGRGSRFWLGFEVGLGFFD